MPIDPTALLTLPLASLLLGLLFVAALYDFLTARQRKSHKETVYRCSGCHRIFVEEHRTPLARCPGCGKQTASPRQ